jgi:pilus assembly protein CpaE
VALVDLDLASGDLAIMFQTMPTWTIHDAAERADRLDSEALDGFLIKHGTGVDVLAAPPEPSLAEGIDSVAVARIITLLRDTYPYVVIDTPSAFTDQVLTALDETDQLVLVAGLDVPSIKNLKLAMHTLDQLGWQRNRMKLVLNRADSKVGLRIRDVEKSLGTSIDIAIPSSRDVPLSINEGQPIVARSSKSTVVESLQKLAATIDKGRSAKAEKQESSGGIFRRRSGTKEKS